MKSGIAYRPDIEGLRAVAILLVVAAHAGIPGLQGGFVGVDVFFVLSGYLISGLLISEIHQAGRLDIVAFYVRRMRRLGPALLLMLLVISLLAVVLLPAPRQLVQTYAATSAALWVSNFYFAFADIDYFSASAVENLFLHTWSLGVEEQFYLIWPMLLLALLGRRGAGVGKRVTAQAAMLVIAVASLVGCVLLSQAAPKLGFYMMPARIWQFALGALAWIMVDRIQGLGRAASVPPAVLLLGGWGGLAAIIGAATLLNENMPYPGWRALIPSLGAAACIASGALTTRAGSAGRALAVTPLQYLGKVSYSWYLWHWPLLVLGGLIITEYSLGMRLGVVVLSLLVAMTSYHLLESPLRQRAFWLIRPARSLQLSFLLVAAVAALGPQWRASVKADLQLPEQVRKNQARTDVPEVYYMGCDDWYRSAALKECSYGKPDAPHVAVIIGDSIGAQWVPAIQKIYNRPDWRVVIYTKSSCPIVDKPIFYARIGREFSECATWRRSVLERLENMQPDIVFLGSAASYELSEADWSEGLASVWARVSRVAKQVRVMRATPILPFNGPDCLDTPRAVKWLKGGSNCAAPADNVAGDQLYGIQQRVVRQFANVQLVDLNDVVCPGKECQAERDGMVIFRDNQHLTASYVESLSPQLEQRVR